MEPTATVGMALSTKIILAVVGLAVAGGVGYSVMTQDEMPGGEADTFSGNIFGLAGRGGDWKCTWAYDQDGVDSEGTVWVSNGRFKSEGSATVAGVRMDMTALSDGEYMYTWTNQMPNGMKFKLDEAQRVAQEPGTSGKAVAQTENLGQAYDYSCERWNADDKTFEMPMGVTFNDFSAMMQGGFMMNESGTDASASIDVEALLKQYQVQ